MAAARWMWFFDWALCLTTGWGKNHMQSGSLRVLEKLWRIAPAQKTWISWSKCPTFDPDRLCLVRNWARADNVNMLLTVGAIQSGAACEQGQNPKQIVCLKCAAVSQHWNHHWTSLMEMKPPDDWCFAEFYALAVLKVLECAPDLAHGCMTSWMLCEFPCLLSCGWAQANDVFFHTTRTILRAGWKNSKRRYAIKNPWPKVWWGEVVCIPERSGMHLREPQVTPLLYAVTFLSAATYHTWLISAYSAFSEVWAVVDLIVWHESWTIIGLLPHKVFWVLWRILFLGEWSPFPIKSIKQSPKIMKIKNKNHGISLSCLSNPCAGTIGLW